MSFRKVIIELYGTKNRTEVTFTETDWGRGVVADILSRARGAGLSENNSVSLLFEGRVLPESMELLKLGTGYGSILELKALERKKEPLASQPFRPDIKARDRTATECLEEYWSRQCGNVSGLEELGESWNVDVLTIQLFWNFVGRDIEKVRKYFDDVAESLL
jgi:hypothetical protein